MYQTCAFSAFDLRYFFLFLLLPHIITLLSTFYFSVYCSYVFHGIGFRGVAWIWLALSSLHFPFILLWLLSPFFLHVR